MTEHLLLYRIHNLGIYLFLPTGFLKCFELQLTTGPHFLQTVTAKQTRSTVTTARVSHALPPSVLVPAGIARLEEQTEAARNRSSNLKGWEEAKAVFSFRFLTSTAQRSENSGSNISFFFF